MDFDELLQKRVIEPCDVEPGEVAGLMRVAQRDIVTASSLMQTDIDWAFAVAYNAILQSSVAFIASHGFRPHSRNKHFNTFRFISAALPEESDTISRLRRFRKKRHAAVYEQPGLIGAQEARDIIEFAGRYLGMIEDRLPLEVRERLREG
jgi:hypothetical protein